VSAAPLLELDDVHAYYGSIHALKGVSLQVREGEVVALIGANGAGKSTALRAITQLVRPRGGSVRFAGAELAGRPAHEVVRRGISLVPEGRRLFPRLSVLENLEMGAYARSDRAAAEEDLERVWNMFPRLAERRAQEAGTLSGGEQQMCAIGRALMARPRLLMLDEPSMGLSPLLVQQIFAVVREVNRAGTTVLLVEQNALQALETAGRAYVLETGRVALAGDAADLRRDPRVRGTYLGEDVD
jgi:branched-chain amino acid transport system ATP-binding protein